MSARAAFMLAICLLPASLFAQTQSLSSGCERVNDPIWDGQGGQGIEIINVSFNAGETIRLTAGFPVTGNETPTGIWFGYRDKFDNTGGTEGEFPGELVYQFLRDTDLGEWDTDGGILGWGTSPFNFSSVEWSAECYIAPLPSLPVPVNTHWGLVTLLLSVLFVGGKALRRSEVATL
jgi:hypothetical protein